MSVIEFIGEGPSPHEISQFFQLGMPPPQFRERHPDEYGATYRANGFRMVAVLALTARDVTDEDVFAQTGSTEGTREKKTYLGPVISPDGLTIGSIALWEQIV